MTKISELTVADLRGARDQIAEHMNDRHGVEPVFGGPTFSIRKNGITAVVWFSKAEMGGEGVDISERAEWDADWSEFMDLVWKRVGQIPSREARELRSVMAKLGDSIELLADSPSEFAVTLTARLKALRDEAGARLIEFQPAE